MTSAHIHFKYLFSQAELQNLQNRMDTAEEYLKSIIGASLDAYGKGEWIACVRAKLREFPDDE